MMLLVGTDKGLFRLVQDAATGSWAVDGPHMAGYSVLHTMLTADETLYAATAHKIWGAHLYRSRDRGIWSARPGTWNTGSCRRRSPAHGGRQLKAR